MSDGLDALARPARRPSTVDASTMTNIVRGSRRVPRTTVPARRANGAGKEVSLERGRLQ